jgi:hypothetical protein
MQRVSEAAVNFFDFGCSAMAFHVHNAAARFLFFAVADCTARKFSKLLFTHTGFGFLASAFAGQFCAHKSPLTGRFAGH